MELEFSLDEREKKWYNTRIMRTLKYETLSKELEQRMEEEKRTGTFVPVAFDEKDVLRRRDNPHDKGTVLRSAFIRDVDKILNCPFYNRYADKTQVFSFVKNDDVTHRSLHVQLVSRIARTIGKALNLNVELIEAIALGHDIGHTPFGHAGESCLDKVRASSTGKRFSHNIHSVRVLDKIFPYNISLQTLSGIASHDGEMEMHEYSPKPLTSFAEFDNLMEKCTLDKAEVKKLVPSTLEGCVMRISDIIAYIGKDRQDAKKLGLIDEDDFGETAIGSVNAEMVNNLMVNIVENSYGKDRICMDEAHFEALKKAKKDDYELIYLKEKYDNLLLMTEDIYHKMLADLRNGNTNSPIYRHHVSDIEKVFYHRETPYTDEAKEDIVVDYIASMTDDYFVELYSYLFPDKNITATYRGYFDKMK